MLTPNFKNDLVFSDYPNANCFFREIQTRSLNYLNDRSYLNKFGLTITSGSIQLVTFEGARCALRILPRAPTLLYKRLSIECIYVQSAIHLTADLLARVAKDTLTSINERRLLPLQVCCVNGYQMKVGLEPREIFDFYDLNRKGEWKPLNK